MLRTSVRLMWTSAIAAALVAPSGVAGQAARRGQVRVPPVRTTPTAVARRPAPKAVVVRDRDNQRDNRGNVRDNRGNARDNRGNARDDRGNVRDDRGNSRNSRGNVRDDRRDDRYDRPDGSRNSNNGWRRVRTGSDLRLFGFLGIDIRWNSWDRNDRRRWVARYDRYDGRGGFYGPVEGWYTPRWGAIRFERDPLRYGPHAIDSRELRRVLGRRVFDRIDRDTPGRSSDLWARVERFGPGGRSMTLEVWSGQRFVAALTDFDRDGWVDHVEVNGRVYR